MAKPAVGTDIYVPSSIYLDHGLDDVLGGLARVTNVRRGLSGGRRVWYVAVREHPGREYNWEQYLEPKQAELERKFALARARPDPDFREEFNRG